MAPPYQLLPSFDLTRPLVSVDLPIDVNLPPDYIADKNMRLRLYRRIADSHSIAEVDALFEEFTDRFGIPPEAVRNLLYQMKVKLYAEQGNISSVSVESDQIVLRFRDGVPPADLPSLHQQVRIGKTGLWMSYHIIAELAPGAHRSSSGNLDCANSSNSNEGL